MNAPAEKIVEPVVDLGMAAEFIRALTGSAETPVTWQTFADQKGASTGRLVRIMHGPLSEVGERLRQLNERGAGVFVTVNRTDGVWRNKDTGEPVEAGARGASLRCARNVAGVRAVFVDADERDGQSLPAALPLMPHIRVRSGGGEHAYWLLVEGESPAEWQEVQKQIARALGTDGAVHDLPRVMRVPGFLHRKGAPQLVTFTEAPGPKLTLAQIRKAYPDPARIAEREERAARREARREGRSDDDGYWRRWALDRLEAKALEVRAAPDGEGRRRLNSAAFAMGAYVPHLIDRHTVEDRLLRVVLNEWERPMSRRRAEATVSRALDDATPWYPSPRRKTAPRHTAPALVGPSPSFTPDDPDWRHELLYGDRGLEPSTGNAIAILENEEEWAGVFALNTRTSRLQVMRRPPYADPQSEETYPRDLTDVDVTWTIAHLESVWRVEFPKTRMHDSIAAVASRNARDPVVEYLDSLRWDGTPRIDRWLIDYFGAEDTALHRAFSARWLISAAARAYRPGAKVNTALILEGAQGIKKSSGLAAMCPDPDWFTDQLPELRDAKSAAEILQGPWIVELAELSSLSRAEVNRQKAFLSTQADKYRAPYAKNPEIHPRRCVFAGTTNDDRYLTDPTGSRRYWPVKVGRVDIEAIRRDRDQLWAEAAERYRAGERWWIDDEGEDAHLARGVRDAGEARYEGDTWEDRAGEYLAALVARGEAFVTAGDVLEHAIGVPPDRQGRSEQTRVGRILRSLGWERAERYEDKRRVRGYRPPRDRQPPPEPEVGSEVGGHQTPQKQGYSQPPKPPQHIPESYCRGEEEEAEGGEDETTGGRSRVGEKVGGGLGGWLSPVKAGGSSPPTCSQPPRVTPRLAAFVDEPEPPPDDEPDDWTDEDELERAIGALRNPGLYGLAAGYLPGWSPALRRRADEIARELLAAELEILRRDDGDHERRAVLDRVGRVIRDRVREEVAA